MNKRQKTLWKSAFASCLLAAVVLLGCSDDRESPTAPSPKSVTLATAVSNSTSAESNAVPLTANTLLPSDHDGSPFTIELVFSEPIVTKPKHILGHQYAFRVSKGSITEASRQDRERRTDGKPGWKTSRWQLTVEPSGEDDVRLFAKANKNCAGASSFCTDDRRSLSHALDLTIRGPAPETAEVHSPTRTPLPGGVGTVTVDWGFFPCSGG